MGAVTSGVPWKLLSDTHLIRQRSLYYVLLLALVKTWCLIIWGLEARQWGEGRLEFLLLNSDTLIHLRTE